MHLNWSQRCQSCPLCNPWRGWQCSQSQFSTQDVINSIRITVINISIILIMNITITRMTIEIIKRLTWQYSPCQSQFSAQDVTEWDDNSRKEILSRRKAEWCLTALKFILNQSSLLFLFANAFTKKNINAISVTFESKFILQSNKLTAILPDTFENQFGVKNSCGRRMTQYLKTFSTFYTYCVLKR